MDTLTDRLARLKRETNALAILISNLKRSPLLQMPNTDPTIIQTKLGEIARQEQVYEANLAKIKELERQLQTA